MGKESVNDGQETHLLENPQKSGHSQGGAKVARLDQAKSAVLNSLSSPDVQRGYRHAIDEFVEWYCSEPRLSFSRAVVLSYRMHLESRGLAPGTINLRLGAVRRLAYEAADCGLLSPDLAAGIRRVKGVKKLGVRLGNWLTAEQAIMDLHGKAGHTRTVPIPDWVKALLDEWMAAGKITNGRVFRRVNKAGSV